VDAVAVGVWRDEGVGDGGRGAALRTIVVGDGEAARRRE